MSKDKLSNLIEALQIFLKYKDVSYPTHCEHDVMMISGVVPSEVSEEDIKKLDDLGFFISQEYDDCFISFRFGSA